MPDYFQFNVEAGARAVTDGDHDMLVEKCRDYRRHKQNKERSYRHRCIEMIENAYINDR